MHTYIYIYIQLHLKRLETRRDLFSNMKQKYGENIKNSFSDVLALRNKKVRMHNFYLREKTFFNLIIFIRGL